ncbi:MAG: flagellar biosynthesis protein FlhB [Pseudomonadales bacterium]|jgi:flagellar biosynthetic protein FlhB
MAEADSGQDRTEEATPRRRQQAQEKGQVPRSRELTTTVLLLGGTAGLMMLSSYMIEGLSALFREGLALDRQMIFLEDAGLLQLGRLTGAAALVLAPLCALLFLLAAAMPVALGGWSFSAESLAPKLSKLDPIKGLGRLFGPRGLMELLKALAKFLLVGSVGALVLWWELDQLLALSGLPLEQALAQTAWLAGYTLLGVSAATALVAAVDVPFQLWQHNKQLRMTRQEVRDEFKETEGRPEVKARIRQLQAEMAQRRMMEAVPEADVVVTNPSHYAVALKYESQRGAPRVLAKGKDLVARAIRDRAAAAGVPRIELPPLARALYAHTRVNEEIPPPLYLAVAQVLAYVYRLRSARTLGTAWPTAPGSVPVPDDLDPGPDAA